YNGGQPAEIRGTDAQQNTCDRQYGYRQHQRLDQMAEMGVAAHWAYKEHGETSTTAQIRAQRWMQSLLELQQSAGSSFEFIKSVKSDLFPDEIYVFTPEGRIVELP
ncbi:hypothetical protein NE471_26560, partial [Escherichia coli]|nr:hypothetical protein [Escherichia coli]